MRVSYQIVSKGSTPHMSSDQKNPTSTPPPLANPAGGKVVDPIKTSTTPTSSPPPPLTPPPSPLASPPIITPPKPTPIVSQSKSTTTPLAQPTITPKVSPSPKPSQPAIIPTTPPSKPPSKSSKIKSSPFKYVGLFIIIALVILAGWFAWSKFAGGDKFDEKAITLTYWGLWEPSQALQTVFADFKTEHPGVTINYVTQSHKDYRERLQAAISRGQGPDIFRFHNTWTPLLKAELSTLPKSIMSSGEFEKTFYPVAQRDLKVGGSYIGIPLEFDGLALYYNTKIFKNANKTPPKTWEELRQLAAELTIRDQQGKIIRGGVALGTTSNVDHWPDILGLMMLQNAANPATPVDSRAEDSLAFYTIFSKSDRVWDDSMPPSTIAFATEKAAMMIAPSWRAFDIKQTNPSLEFATVLTPQLTNVNLHWASYWVEGVSKQSTPDKQELSWQLIKFMSQPENLRSFYQDASQVRLFGEPYSRVDMQEELSADPIVGAFVSSAPTAQSWWLSSWTHDNGLNDRIIKYYEDAVNIVNQGKTPKKALETTSEGVVQILSQFGVSGAL